MRLSLEPTVPRSFVVLVLLGAACGPAPVDLPTDAGADPVDAGEPLPIELPPNFSWCADGEPCRTATLDAKVCAEGSQPCTPTRSTRLEARVNGAPIANFGVLVRAPDVGLALEVVGSGYAYGPFLMGSGASGATLASDLPLSLSYDDVAPIWGGTTVFDWQATARRQATGRSFFFRSATFEPGVTHEALALSMDLISHDLRTISGVTPVDFRAFLLPTELAIVVGGEGNFAFEDGTITINYGNPDWITAQGGVAKIVAHEFAHEYTHTLFSRVSTHFAGNATCLNEGLADALGNFAGYVPDADFGGPQDGSDFAQGCGASTEIHAKGNCPFWHAKRDGLTTSTFFARLFATGRMFEFDSCDLTSERTGNAYLVLFTEAGGRDAGAIVTSAGLPHAGSYAAAKAALGF